MMLLLQALLLPLLLRFVNSSNDNTHTVFHQVQYHEDIQNQEQEESNPTGNFRMNQLRRLPVTGAAIPRTPQVSHHLPHAYLTNRLTTASNQI